jgi:uncharacterized phiE125 gp8 family phage protein
MPLRRLTQPSVEPLTLAEAKAHLREVGTSEDAYITALIPVARQQAENIMRRTIITSSWVKTEDRFPAAIRLPMGRVQSITEVRYRDPDGVDLVMAPVGYTLDNSGDGRPAWLYPSADYDWPDTWDQPNGVAVTYSAGFGPTAADVPEPIKQWMLLTIGTHFAHREAVVTGTIVAALPEQFHDGLLDQFVIVQP